MLSKNFLFKVIEQYIEHYKERNENQYKINNNVNQIDKRKKLEQKKKYSCNI